MSGPDTAGRVRARQLARPGSGLHRRPAPGCTAGRLRARGREASRPRRPGSTGGSRLGSTTAPLRTRQAWSRPGIHAPGTPGQDTTRHRGRKGPGTTRHPGRERARHDEAPGRARFGAGAAAKSGPERRSYGTRLAAAPDRWRRGSQRAHRRPWGVSRRSRWMRAVIQAATGQGPGRSRGADSGAIGDDSAVHNLGHRPGADPRR
jgi:hypothetical protein